MIPKIFHRVVPETPSAEADHFWTTLQSMHPGWEFRSWNDPQDPDKFELGREFIHATSGAQLADLVRLEVLHEFGGVYVDSDIEPVKNFEPLLNERAFIGTEDGQILTNAVMGSEPRHPGFRKLIDAILREGRTRLDAQPNESTGPHLVTELLGGWDDITVLPPEFFYPYNYMEPRPRDIRDVTTNFTYAVHHWAGSWTHSRPGKRSLTPSVKHRVRRVAERIVARTRQVYGLPSRGAAYVGDNRVIVGLPDGSPLICLADDLSLTPELVANGIYDPVYWSFLSKFVKPGDQVVEVGSNIGLFTVRIAKLVGRFGHVFAWEPDPELHRVAADNLEANWVHERVSLHQRAVASDAGVAHFATQGDQRGWGRLTTEGSGDLTVEVDRLDQVLRNDMPIRLVKINVEGGEADVLAGLRGLLDSRCIRMIDVEVIRSNAGDLWLDLVGQLNTLVSTYGATVHLLGSHGDLSEASLDSIVARAGHFPHVIFRLPVAAS